MSQKVHKSILTHSAAACSLLFCSCVTPSLQKTEDSVDSTIRGELGGLPQAWAEQSNVQPITIGWIHSFGDSTLTGLLRDAQENNKDIRIASANVERAIAIARQAGAERKPQVNVDAGAGVSGTLSDESNETNAFSLGAQVDWEIDLWGRVRSQSQAAYASAEAAEADYLFAQYLLAAATAKVYFANIDANIQVTIAEEKLELTEETNRITRVKVENGAGTEQDLSLSNADLATARESLATLQGVRRDAIRSLEVLLGRYPSAELAVTSDLPLLPTIPDAGIPADLLERRPDLISAERSVAAAFNLVNQAKAAKLPKIGISSSIRGASDSASDVFNSDNILWNLGGNLLAPIFRGGALDASVEISTAEQEAAIYSYAQTALNAFQEVESLLDQGAILDERVKQLEIVEEESAEAYRIAEIQYREGESDLLDLINFQNRLISARSGLASIKRALLDQRVDLHLALGGNWE